MRNNLPSGAQPWAKQVSKTLNKDRRKLSRDETNKRATQVNIAVGGARLAKVDTNEADNRSNETRLEDLEGSLGGTIEGFDDILNNEETGVIPMVEWQKEHLEEVDILVGELQDNYNDVVDPFIRDTENALQVELPDAIDRAKDAQEKALESLGKVEGLITIGNEPPAHGPGKVWMQTGDFEDQDGGIVENRLMGIWQSVDNTWQTYTLMAGTFIVPGEDGIPTVIDGNGVVTGNVAADSITGKVIQAGSVGADVFIAGSITKGTEENPGPLGDDVKETLNEAEEWANRVVIDPESITISRSPVGSGALTALRLEATRLDFVVSGNSVAHIDAEKNFMSIGNAYIRESIQVGEHQIKKNGSGITTFQWTGA